MIFINPDSRTNKDIPNLAVAYAATLYRSRVVDLNTMPDPGNRFYDEKENDYVLSVQSRNYGHAQKTKEGILSKRPDASVRTRISVRILFPVQSFLLTRGCEKSPCRMTSSI